MSICCFFIGHRVAPISLLSALENTIEKHISHFHVDEFIIGRYGDFDHMAAQAVKNVKRQHPGIRLTMLLAYYNPQKPTPLTEGFDGSLFPDGLEFVPKRCAIMKANLYMVKHCDYLITYDKGIVGNTRIIVDTILNLKTHQKSNVYQ